MNYIYIIYLKYFDIFLFYITKIIDNIIKHINNIF